ncbi:hypothetical protein [Sphingomonas sp. PR090111-T3T-6A]|uniref:hypothetical protein n=1 Tax=Sphingomonas sp. PR090111-T3T-6A TaxID=685778 RepID=UPI0003670636|nr:hypothetical protein [Sphingomonas sp. PR090111-T3T-6A]
MAESGERAGAGSRNYWRIVRWIGILVLVLTPLVMTQISDQWHWTIGGSLFAGAIIGGIELLYELAEKRNESRAYRAGAGIALVTPFLTVWTTIVRDDGNGIGSLMLVMAAVVGSFAAWFRPAGMARAMLGIAIMQALLCIAIATAPSTAAMEDSTRRALFSGGFFMALWLASAAFFRVAATAGNKAARRPHLSTPPQPGW